VGLAGGFAAVNFRVLGKIVVYWLLTVPIAALTSIIIFQLLRWSLL
jgi:inorganic phosphate transporter, PiT family